MSNQRKSKRQERQAARQQSKRNRTLLTSGGILLFVGILIYFTWQQMAGGAAIPAADVPDPIKGRADAPIEIVEYGDFGCPACRAWHNAGIAEEVLAQFGEQVRFVWRDFPIITAQSPQAAEAGHCAAAQGKFWAYHDYLYEQSSGLSLPLLEQAATEVGLDRAAFDLCLAEGQMKAKVQANDQAARRLGLRGTPGFSFNGQPLPGPPSAQQLISMIQQQLGE